MTALTQEKLTQEKLTQENRTPKAGALGGVDAICRVGERGMPPSF